MQGGCTVLALFCACVLLLQGDTQAFKQTVGKIARCPNSKGSALELSGSWSPFALKPNTMYSMNASFTAEEDIDEVIGVLKVFSTLRPDPIFPPQEKRMSCKDALGDASMVFSFLNLTCPIKAGTKRTVTNLEKFLPGTEAAITGDFVVEVTLKSVKGHDFGCWTANATITN